ncbi:ABC transporter ATP-binding protein [Xylanibacillus composti]|nr:ABC transporter ATP-binding protein [Xylanibacillus composti]
MPRHPGPRPGGGPMGGPMGGGPMGGRMGAPGEKAKDFKGTLKRLLGYLKPRKYQLFAVFAAAILSTLFGILAPKIMGDATTKLFEGVMARMNGVEGAAIDFAYIGNIIVILIGLYAFSSIFSYVQQYVMAGVAQKTVYELRREVNAKLNRMPLKYFDSRTHGETLSRMTNDVDNISNTMQQSLTQLITSVVTIVGVVVMMLTISPLLTLICLLTLPLSAVVTARVAKRSQGHFIGQQRSLGELNGHVEEMYAGHNLIQVFRHEKKSIETFKEINERLYQSGWRAQFISGIMMPLISFVGNIGYVLICVVGGILVAGQRIAIGDVQAFIQYARQFSMPITQAANIANIIQSTVASAERVFELLDEEEEERDAEQGTPASRPRGAVAFEHVRFGYKEDALLMEDLNIEVKPGQMVAIVGPTGAGKTTLVNLLMRFYEIGGGRITIDGRDIREIARGELRSLFGMVLQDTWLFNGTIRDNIGYGREHATEEEVVRAAEAAHADHFIRTLPEGYDTVLNEEASNLSQGQKQLLTIARAILADPAILILDEATSSVDTRTEVLIQNAMSRLMEGRTSFVIAHRLSTIRNADVILVMNKGSVIEQGTHEELLAAGGFYANLYNSQFQEAV